jgi:hypothetical protein
MVFLIGGTAKVAQSSTPGRGTSVTVDKRVVRKGYRMWTSVAQSLGLDPLRDSFENCGPARRRSGF